MFSIKSGISAFPDLFEEFFVVSESCSPKDVLSILQLDLDDCHDDKLKVAGYLKNTIKRMCESGM